MKKVVAIVGMAGSGKTEVARTFTESGFTRIRFGDITDAEIKKKGLELSEANERAVRETLRNERGMAAYAILNQPRIDAALEHADVAVDGLYSWEEYTFLKKRYGKGLSLVAVWSSPETRYRRLASRAERPLSAEETANRDRAEIEMINKGGPIALADYTIINESSRDNLKAETEKVIADLKTQ